MLRRTVREFLDDGGTDLAAALTYYSVLAIFPGLIALLALVGVFGQAEESVDEIMEILAPLVTDDDRSTGSSDTLTELASTGGRRAHRWSSVCSVRSGPPRATSAPSAAR